jgi:hypothetical protein
VRPEFVLGELVFGESVLAELVLGVLVLGESAWERLVVGTSVESVATATDWPSMSSVVMVVEEVDESVDEAPMGTDDGASIAPGRAAA